MKKPQMIDHMLRFLDKEEFLEVVYFAFNSDGEFLNDTIEYSFDTIGKVCIEEGEFNEKDELIKPPVIDDRFHINIRCTETISQKIPNKYKVTPDTPIRTWL